MTDSRQPPVNEVVLSVALASQDLLIGPRLPEILGPLFNEYNKIEVAPPYNMPSEYQSPEDGWLERRRALKLCLLVGWNRVTGSYQRMTYSLSKCSVTTSHSTGVDVKLARSMFGTKRLERASGSS